MSNLYQQTDNLIRNLRYIDTIVKTIKERKAILDDFKAACSKASYHFADDTGKEWRTAQSYAEKAKNIASANPEYMGEYLEILKDQLVSQGDIFGY